jgi:TPR repeat protein
MADDPLKPLIRGMLVMILMTATVLSVHALREVVLDEQRRMEATNQAAQARQGKWQQEREAAELQAKSQREEYEDRLAQGRARDHATLEAIQAKKRPVDVGAAFGNVRRKAEGGDANAQYLLGRIYLRGMDGVLHVQPSNYALTYHAPTAAALTGEKDFARTANTLRFINLPLIQEDMKEAVRWHEYAAQQGHREAQSSLAQLFYYRLPNPVEGYRWALLSERPPILPDELKLEAHTPEWRKATKESLLQKLTPAQKAEAEQQAAAFIRQEKPSK